jgi:5'(3')-deoxyribonucleotidase
MKKRIAVDMDEVIAEVEPKLKALYEAHTGKPLPTEDYRGKKIYSLPGVQQLRQKLFEPGFFADLPVMPGSQEQLKWLQQHYDIYIVTAAAEFRNSLAEKHAWLEAHFPFIHWKQMVFCGDKSIIKADYMIDDHPHNLETFQGKGLLFTAYHNVDEGRFERVNNWREVRAFFERELNLV